MTQRKIGLEVRAADAAGDGGARGQPWCAVEASEYLRML